MKVFISKGKFNFVDENNVLVGYDMEQCCCEHADWFTNSEVVLPPARGTKEAWPPEEDEEFEWADWRFDPEFFQDHQCDYLDAGGLAIFRMVNGDKEKFLHLFNIHNGYYGHGFSMEIQDKIVHEGGL